MALIYTSVEEVAVTDGIRTIPCDLDNTDWKQIVSDELPIASFVPAAITIDDVRAEAARRIIKVAPEWMQRNLLAQASLLGIKKSENWDTDDQAAFDAGNAIWLRIAALRAASNVMEGSPPEDYADDSNWPE